MDPQEHIVIVGAGTFGLSTALELLRKGHKNLTLIDGYPIPSPLSAGNDVNKVFQSTVEDEFYSVLAQESLAKWRSDPLYKPAFNEVGIIYGGSGEKATREINRRYDVLIKNGEEVEKLSSSEDFGLKMPIEDIEQQKLKRFQGWNGYHQKTKCGWTFARLALENVSEEVLKLGAKFICDKVENLIFDKDVCVGVKTFSGQIVKGDKIVICAGASSINLLDFENQLLAKCWTVGHIQLTEDEAKSLKGLPVVLNIDEGFFFEPDENNQLKFCNEFPGYINLDSEKRSIPVYRHEIPKEAKDQMRSFLAQVFPESIANRDFCVSKICWCTDTTDRHFLISEHPKYKGLVLGTGDSGKGFKYMPIIGEYISAVVLNGNSSLDEEKQKAWKWRPETAKDRDIYELQARMGGLNIIKDLKDIDEWTC